MEEDKSILPHNEFDSFIFLELVIILKARVRYNIPVMNIFFAFFLFLSLGLVSSCKEHSNQQENIGDSFAKKIKGSTQSTPPGWPWRGITIVTHVDRKEITEKKIQDLAKKGVNLVRLRLDFPKFAKHEKINIDQSIHSTLNWSKQVIEWCEQHGILVLISYTNFPIVDNQNYNQTSAKFWNSQDDLDKVLDDIDMMVRSFDKYKNVVAYEFIAEPVMKVLGKSFSPPQWNNFYKRIIKTVRGTSDKYLLYAPGPWGGPGGYGDMGEKFDDPKIIYNFHFYRPHLYTHQGIRKNEKQYTYPGKIKSVYWDKDQLDSAVKVVVDWAEKENVKFLFVGEFSAVKWAEGKDHYLSDAISIFEKYDMGWAYFAYNGWQGWSYTQKKDFEAAQRNAEDKSLFESTDRTQKIIESFWAKNKQK